MGAASMMLLMMGNSKGSANSRRQRYSHHTTNGAAPSTVPSAIGPVLGHPLEEVRKTYTVRHDCELGRDKLGVTYLCIHRATGAQFACKTIPKRKLSNKQDMKLLRREVHIMHHLRGQPNIVELKGAYEDMHQVSLVMELCPGGHLFDRIVANGRYTEPAAATLCRTIVQIVYTCHSMGVAHLNIKPENFLLMGKGENAPLKATGFGRSVFFKPGQVFRDVAGSVYYVAPEVLRRRYGPEADVWSAGVILYILLSGVHPFCAESEQGIFDSILSGHIDCVSDPWPSISASAKDLVKKMLNSNPKERLTAMQVLNHPWIRT